MLCWGYWSFGLPGAGNSLQAIITEPQSCSFVHEKNVREVACGGSHSIFLLEDGQVYTCGLNSKGQLGHAREGNKPGKLILSLWSQPLLVTKSAASAASKGRRV